MVDQQTPAVRSEDELEREDAAPRDAQQRRDDAGDLPIEENRRAQSDAPDQLPPAGNIADIDDDRAAREARGEAAPERRGPSEDPGLKVRHAATAGGSADAALFDQDASQGYKDRWLVIQTEFVDNPKAAVEKAESLVGEVMQALTDSFARQRRDLESGLARGDDASTEDLRQSIRRYRSFFNRLLAF